MKLGRAAQSFLFTKGQGGQWKAQSQSLHTWDAAACPYLKRSKNWYLVDAFETATLAFKLGAKTWLACTLDRKHYSNLVKDGGQCVFELRRSFLVGRGESVPSRALDSR